MTHYDCLAASESSAFSSGSFPATPLHFPFLSQALHRNPLIMNPQRSCPPSLLSPLPSTSPPPPPALVPVELRPARLQGLAPGQHGLPAGGRRHARALGHGLGAQPDPRGVRLVSGEESAAAVAVGDQGGGEIDCSGGEGTFVTSLRRTLLVKRNMHDMLEKVSSHDDDIFIISAYVLRFEATAFRPKGT